MIIALAGRRIDAEAAPIPRFPQQEAAAVAARLREFMTTHEVSGLVSAAACGADLLALEVAGELGLRRRVVLPLGWERFRATSVVDRGGDWGARYDAVLAEVIAKGDLVEFAHNLSAANIWEVGNVDILNEAERLALQTGADLAVLIVWDGQSRGADDVTENFKQLAEARGLGVAEILTLPRD